MHTQMHLWVQISIPMNEKLILTLIYSQKQMDVDICKDDCNHFKLIKQITKLSSLNQALFVGVPCYQSLSCLL